MDKSNHDNNFNDHANSGAGSDRFNIDQLAKKLASLAPASLQHIQKDLEDNMHAALDSGLRKMNLVSREEFDVQTAVLARTREKLEKLEKIVKELESRK